ncbi:fucolectin-7-like isoform X2 [Myxocyprinus asiaticus]|uniref:fucolectin-7-like isoform X2 n=1 Tax=Myxocyprinus asiaticus TaxID=70543 RepID=UPI002221A57D|nr:fucolectin-7-like isoform X2 [Myxocyprinus asiaticus]
MTGFYRYMLLLLGFFSMTKKSDGVEVNAARSGTTSQSSTDFNWYSQYATDGVSTSCTHTLIQANPWWRVDLLKTLSVDRLVVTNRPDCCAERINGAEIRVGHIADIYSNPVCCVIPSIPAGASYTCSCNGREGRYVYVVLPSASGVLTVCEVEVYGVLPENLALGKNATQSSTWYTWYAGHAIDGNRGLSQPSTWCSSTHYQNNPWWRVDLHNVYKVSRVVVTNRADCCLDQVNGVKILIGNSLEDNGNNNSMCAVIPSIAAGGSATFVCNYMEGRYVNLISPRNSTALPLCEVEVYGIDQSHTASGI